MGCCLGVSRCVCMCVCVSGGVIKHSLVMMDVRVGVSGRTLVEAECGCVLEEFSGWFWVFCTVRGCWLLCVSHE